MSGGRCFQRYLTVRLELNLLLEACQTRLLFLQIYQPSEGNVNSVLTKNKKIPKGYTVICENGTGAVANFWRGLTCALCVAIANVRDALHFV